MSGPSKTEGRSASSRHHWSLNMRKVWLGILGAVVCLGLGLAVVGCDSATANKDQMGGAKMGGDRMRGTELQRDKMGSGMMSDDKMAGDKMGKK
jgi:pentapeptide MXKDX repeat protein